MIYVIEENTKKEFSSLITGKRSIQETTFNQFNFFIIDTEQKKEKTMHFVHENAQKSIKIEQI